MMVGIEVAPPLRIEDEMTVLGPSRHFAAAQQFGRFLSEALTRMCQKRPSDSHSESPALLRPSANVARSSGRRNGSHSLRWESRSVGSSDLSSSFSE